MSIFYSPKTITARTTHQCDQCGRVIDRGETYRGTKSVDYDGWQTWTVCAQCQACVEDLWDIEVRDENDYGHDVYAYLPDVDWGDVRLWSPLWALRADRYAQRWAGQPYPEVAP